MDTAKKRIDWIDFCKALGIYLVVLGHVGVPKNIDMIIQAFHMPVFFILSGLCFNEIKHKSFSKFIKSRLLTLILPYILFSIFLFIFWDGVLHLYYPNQVKPIKEFFIAILYPANTHVFGSVNWFLPSLFFVEVTFWLILKLCKNSKLKCGIIMFLISIIAYMYPKLTDIRLLLAIDSSLMGFVFYGIGWLIKSVNFDLIKDFIKKHFVTSQFVVIILAVVFIPIVIYNKMVNISVLWYGNYFLFFINALYYSFVLIIFSMILDIYSEKTKLLNWIKTIGKHTLVILLLNPITVRMWELISDGMILKMSYKSAFVLELIIAFILLIICTLCSIFINKFMPFLLGKWYKKTIK